MRKLLPALLLLAATAQMAPAQNAAGRFKPALLADMRGRFTALNQPQIVTAAEATWLQDGEEVLGVSVNGEHRAYAARQIWWHHIVNDRLGGAPLTVTY